MTAPIGGPYAELAVLKRRMGVPDSDTTKDEDLADSIASASDAINRWCGRQFGRVEVASERAYYSTAAGITTDDFWTLDDLTVGGAAYTATSYDAIGGVRDGVPGWPYTALQYAAVIHPILAGVALSRVAVTAKWGWAAVPDGVRQACLMLAADDFKSGDAPFGVAGFGDYVVRIRANPKVAEKLAPYTREPAKVAS